MKTSEGKNEYISMCNGKETNLMALDNASREIQNEMNYKQKFIDIDNKQSQINQRFEKNVLTEEIDRVKHKETIMKDKPSYIDKLTDTSTQYLSNRKDQLKSVYEFQKDRINEKYKELSTKASTITKMGEMSEQELQKYRDEQLMAKMDNKQRQSSYADFLTTQVKSKKWDDKSNENQDMNMSIGKYKVSRNSSVPMVPGISSVTKISPQIFNEKNRK